MVGVARTRRFDGFWLVLLVLPPLLLLPNLGGSIFWQDEAETALLARSVEQHGYPLAYDGRRTISDQPGAPDVSKDGVWIWTPWLQLYTVAASFLVLGDSETAGRLPFVLAGWASILVSYALFRSLTRHRVLARTAVLLLVLSVPFALQLRQCRYYGLLPLFVMLGSWGYLRMAHGERGGSPLFVVAGIGLSQTLPPQLVALALAAGADALLVRRDRALVRRVVLAAAIVAGAALPFFLYSQGWSRDYLQKGHGFESFERFAATVRAYLVAVQLYAWPFLLAPLALVPALPLSRRARFAVQAVLIVGAALLACALVARAGPVSLLGVLVLAGLGAGIAVAAALTGLRSSLGAPLLEDGAPFAALLLVATLLLFSALAPDPYYRYLTGVLPWFALATAVLVFVAARGRTLAIAGLVLALTLTEGLARSPFSLAERVVDRRGRVSTQSRAVGCYRLVRFMLVRSRDAIGFPWLLAYVSELMRDYDGPVEMAIRYLRAHAEPGDAVLVRYEHYPFMYYTNLDVYRWDEADSLGRLPEWAFKHGAAGGKTPAQLKKALDGYEKIWLGVDRFPWENLPEPALHRFVTSWGRSSASLLHLDRSTAPAPTALANGPLRSER